MCRNFSHNMPNSKLKYSFFVSNSYESNKKIEQQKNVMLVLMLIINHRRGMQKAAFFSFLFLD